MSQASIFVSRSHGGFDSNSTMMELDINESDMESIVSELNNIEKDIDELKLFTFLSG